jgi:hypothetical protein
MLVEPGVDPPDRLRARPRARRVPRQGPRLDGEREAMAAGQADGAAQASRAAASETDGAGASRADHHAFLPPDLAAAMRQAACPPRHAQRDVAEPSGRLSRGRPRAYPPRGRVPRRAVRAEAAGNVALGRLGLPGRHSGHRGGGHPVDRHRRGDPLLLDRRLGGPRRQRLPPQSRNALSPLARRRAGQIAATGLPAPGAPKNRASRCNWSSATTP